MKKSLIILIMLTLIFLGLYIHTVYYSDHGADGLSGFFGAIFYGALFLICMIGSIGLSSIALFPNTSNRILFIGATLFSILAVYIVLASTFLPAISIW